MSVFGYIIPGSRRLSRIRFLDHEAKYRLAFIEFYFRIGKKAALTCETFKISKDTLYRWLKRYKPYNLLTLIDDRSSRRPHKLRASTIDWRVVEKVVSLRKANPSWSKYKLGEILRREDIKISTSSIGRILKRRGLIDQKKSRKLSLRRRLAIERKKAEKELKDKGPGYLVQMDTKQFCILGQRFYQFTAIDTATRIKYIQVFRSAGSKNATSFLEELLNYLPFPIKAVQTDNGSEFLKYFHQVCLKHNITHYFTDPYCPKQNARVERSIQTDLQEYWE